MKADHIMLTLLKNRPPILMQLPMYVPKKNTARLLLISRKERVKMLAQAREDIEKNRQCCKELQSQIMDIAMLAAKKIIMTGDQYDAKER